MLTIIHNASCTQVVHVAPQFYLTVELGKGKFKKVLTSTDKSYDFMRDVNGVGFNLTKQDKTIATGGNTNPLLERTDYKKSEQEKIHLKKMKYYFRKDIKVKYPSEKGNAESIFKKYATTITHSSSTTQTK